jgi:Flp pilus assembly pilin Flp
MSDFVRNLWSHEEGQDIAEYAVMLAVILVLVVGTIRLVGGSANTCEVVRNRAVGERAPQIGFRSIRLQARVDAALYPGFQHDPSFGLFAPPCVDFSVCLSASSLMEKGIVHRLFQDF